MNRVYTKGQRINQRNATESAGDRSKQEGRAMKVCKSQQKATSNPQAAKRYYRNDFSKKVNYTTPPKSILQRCSSTGDTSPSDTKS